MAEKALSVEELLRFAQAGAKITTEKREHILANIQEADPGPTVIAQFEELIEKLGDIGKYDDLVKKLTEMTEATKAMVKSNERVARSNENIAKANESLAAAEKEKSKTQLEVLATLQSLIKAGNVPKVQPVDLTPLKSVLSEINANSKPQSRPGYEFNIKRGRQGFLEKITAIPKH